MPSPTHARDTAHCSIAEEFAHFDAAHPWVYAALEHLTAQRLASGARRVGMKALFEALRWQQPRPIPGLNNNYTSLYARKLIRHHPEWARAFELRRLRAH
ncbi:hypothetical protein ACIBUY_04100 [Streptomyces sp. NPDC050085]|uniref:hypothetical protein n=1 Tax=Streptomyces sp. NPDC050085 TaxID=3365600 RepID=UPI003794CE82